MPTHNRVRVHDNQGGAPIPPRLGEQHPKQSISVAELGTPRGALEHSHLLTEREILERDGSVSTAEQRERSKRDDERGQHESSCPGTATASTGTVDLILANDSRGVSIHDRAQEVAAGVDLSCDTGGNGASYDCRSGPLVDLGS